jgi:hypothetical protein
MATFRLLRRASVAISGYKAKSCRLRAASAGPARRRFAIFRLPPSVALSGFHGAAGSPAPSTAGIICSGCAPYSVARSATATSSSGFPLEQLRHTSCEQLHQPISASSVHQLGRAKQQRLACMQQLQRPAPSENVHPCVGSSNLYAFAYIDRRNAREQ